MSSFYAIENISFKNITDVIKTMYVDTYKWSKYNLFI